jgi:hypothetical protein
MLGAATQYTVASKSSNFPPDGLMGMGFIEISAYGAPPTFVTLIALNKLESAVFSSKLSATGSELFLGGINHDLFTGNFTWLPLHVKVCRIRKT